MGKKPETLMADLNKLMSQDSIYGGDLDQSKVGLNQPEEVYQDVA